MMPDYKYDRKRDRRLIQGFAQNYLKQDGVFILRLIGKNVNEVILCEIVLALYEIYKKKKSKTVSSLQRLNKENDIDEYETTKFDV